MPVKIKREYPLPYYYHVTHFYRMRAKSLQASLDACKDKISAPNDKHTTSIIKILSSPELRPTKKPKLSEHLVGSYNCSLRSKYSNPRCT